MRTTPTPSSHVDERLTALADDLGVPETDVAFLADAEPEALDRLHAALRRAHARQERELAEAFEGTAALIPRPLRGRVRKLLLGS